MIAEADTITIGGVEFVHGCNDQFEYYAHTDERDWSWEVFRHLQGPNTEAWLAMTCEAGRNGRARLLNSATQHLDGTLDTDPLYHIDVHDKIALLAGVAELVKVGKWPA